MQSGDTSTPALSTLIPALEPLPAFLNRSLMISNFLNCHSALRNVFSVGILICSLSIGGSSSAVAQEANGVKIALKLTPSQPDEPTKTSSDSLPSNDDTKKNNPSVESSTQASLSEKPVQATIRNPLALNAFQLPLDKGATKATKSRVTAPSGASLTLEQSPTPVPGSNKADGSAPAKLDAAKSATTRKLSSGLDDPKEIKPLPNSNSKVSKKGDNTGDNEDAECPGGTESTKPLAVLPDDIPLQQEDHPYDAPAAESSSAKPDRPVSGAQLQLSSEQVRLRAEINQLLQYYIQNPETIARRSPWAVMHAILPFGVEAELSAGNRRVNAIGWMSYNGLCKTQRIFQPTKSGFRTNLGPGVQGHEGQFLAILAQSKVAPTYPVKVGDRSYTVNDLVRYEMATCREKSELTFKLLGLSYYLEPNQRWRDNQGGNWSLEKLVAEELEQPIVGSACGGTHRLMGLTFSLLQRKQAGLPISGHWERSEQFLNEFVAYAFSLQNPDGSFSTDWFEARANAPSVERKIQTTGHVLEWLIYTLPEEQLQSLPIQKAIRYLLSTLGAEPGRDWPIGPRGHSLRALALYNQRVFGAQPGKLKQYIANLNTESKQR